LGAAAKSDKADLKPAFTLLDEFEALGQVGQKRLAELDFEIRVERARCYLRLGEWNCADTKTSMIDPLMLAMLPT
jgi:hypothetical protein